MSYQLGQSEEPIVILDGGGDRLSGSCILFPTEVDVDSLDGVLSLPGS